MSFFYHTYIQMFEVRILFLKDIILLLIMNLIKETVICLEFYKIFQIGSFDLSFHKKILEKEEFLQKY